MDERHDMQNGSLKQIVRTVFQEKTSILRLTEALQTVKKQRKVSQREVADLILFMADTNDREWNLEQILKTVNETFENINWRDVYEKFFESDLKICSREYLYTLVDCWVCISGIITVPYEMFFRKWENRKNQLEFFRVLLDCDEKRTQVYSNIFFEKLVTKEDLRNKYKRNIEYENNLNAVELFKSLREIDGTDIVEMICEKSPEYCILGLAAVQPFCEELLDDLLAQFTEGVTSQLVYHILFLRHCDVILHSFNRLCERVSLTRILDILLEHKMLPIITEVPSPENFCFDIIILSSRRDHLNLEIWLSNYIKKNSGLFVRYLEKKLLRGEDAKTGTAQTDSEVFPFNKTIINGVLRTIEMNFKELSAEEISVIRNIRLKMNDSKNGDRANYSEKAVTFISEVVNSQIDVEDSISMLRDLVKGDEASIGFAKKVFGLLIDNYSSLYRFPNSDMLATFFGELLKQKILVRPFFKVSLQLVKNSLRYPENDREYAFAFRILEIFFPEVPEFLFEIEDIENVRYGLIKKELIIVDDDMQREVGVDELVSIVFSKEDDNGTTKFVGRSLEETLDALKLSDKKSRARECEITPAQICRCFYRTLDAANAQLFATHCLNTDDEFHRQMIQWGFAIMKLMFTYKIQNESEYCELLGAFLGKVTIGRDRPVNLDLFDFHSFLLKSIEYRRITVTVSFVVGFLKEGRSGMIFVPQNPWLMSVLDVLVELYPCTLLSVRQKIEELYSVMGLKLTYRQTMRMKEHLVKYAIKYDGVVCQVISAALDFSIREICNKVIHSCLGISRKTAKSLFGKIGGENRFFLFRNLLVNLTRSLIHISAQEPLKASMCGNITHFLKLSLNEIPLDAVYAIVSQNLMVCCLVVEKAGITQVNEIVPGLYGELLENEKKRQGSAKIAARDPKNALRILSESFFVEKVSIRSIENVEYQEIRSFLIQQGKKMPAKKKDYISEEWQKLFGADKMKNFQRIMTVIVNSPEKDEMCLSLCKYLVGHALKTNCIEEHVFGFIRAIFNVSPKCKREVVGWLIYSEDTKKFNIPLIRKFIEYDFLCLEEFDQSLAKLLKICDQKFLGFVLDLLDTLMHEDVRLCIVYDFIYTIEALNKMNDNPRVFDFFKKVETGMMRFQEGAVDLTVFDEFLRELHTNIPHNKYLSCFHEKHRMEKQNFKSAFKSCWNHFVLYSGSYRFFKIDILAALVRDDLYGNLLESVRFLVLAYSRKNYLFFLFYCRFVVRTLNYVEDTMENRSLVWKLVELLSPSNIPGFVMQFMEILNHPFIAPYLERSEAYWIAKEILEAVTSNNALEAAALDFFMQHLPQFSKFNIYLSYLCPTACTDLKNLFNQSRPRTLEKSTNSFFATFFLFTKHMKPPRINVELLEHLCDDTPATMNVIESLKGMIEKRTCVHECTLLLMLRLAGKNAPYGVKQACNELFRRNDISEIVTEYNAKFFNKT